jgi:hypothetical protein
MTPRMRGRVAPGSAGLGKVWIESAGATGGTTLGARDTLPSGADWVALPEAPPLIVAVEDVYRAQLSGWSV